MARPIQKRYPEPLACPIVCTCLVCRVFVRLRHALPEKLGPTVLVAMTMKHATVRQVQVMAYAMPAQSPVERVLKTKCFSSTDIITCRTQTTNDSEVLQSKYVHKLNSRRTLNTNGPDDLFKFGTARLRRG